MSAPTLKYSNGSTWTDIPLGSTNIDTVCGVAPNASKNVPLTASNVGALPVAGGIITGTNDATSTVDENAALVVKGGIACAKQIWGAAVHGAVWNDYAEYRHMEYPSEGTPGRALIEDGKGGLEVPKGREPGASIVTDTFGFSIGKSDTATIPVAVAGRVLAQMDKNCSKKKCVPGAAVCTVAGGTLRVMGKLEKILHPDCIVGYISEVPDYEVWHGEVDVNVNGRVWIKLK